MQEKAETLLGEAEQIWDRIPVLSAASVKKEGSRTTDLLTTGGGGVQMEKKKVGGRRPPSSKRSGWTLSERVADHQTSSRPSRPGGGGVQMEKKEVGGRRPPSSKISGWTRVDARPPCTDPIRGWTPSTLKNKWVDAVHLRPPTLAALPVLKNFQTLVSWAAPPSQRWGGQAKKLGGFSPPFEKLGGFPSNLNFFQHTKNYEGNMSYLYSMYSIHNTVNLENGV